MTESAPFRVSQGFEVLQPKSGHAYPVPCDEWAFLKKKLSQVSDGPWLYQTIGSVFAGAASSTLITILTGTFLRPPQSPALIIAWAVVAVCAINAAVLFVSASQQRKVRSVQTSDVLTQMELIEHRYESATEGQSSTQKKLIIVSARYGQGTQYKDITYMLTRLAESGALEVIADNNLGGDPCPNTKKELIVEYNYNGKLLKTKIEEGKTLKLPEG